MNSTNQKIYNFCAGPCVLPREVLQQSADEMLNWNNTGISFLELSHRSKEYCGVSEGLRTNLRSFLEIPDNFKILFFQGGASMQYASMIKNLLRHDESGKSKGACYVDTGYWSNQCLNQAKRMLGSVQPTCVASGKDSRYTTVKAPTSWNIDKNASYIHYCQNETVHGFQFHDQEDNSFPWNSVGDLPVVCDMSSDIGSRKVDWNRYGMVYAGAQKNLGAAGVCVVIVREDLLGKQAPDTPFLLDWDLYNKSQGCNFNTPATYPIYITALNVAHMIKSGGLNHYIDLAQKRSKMIYGFIDNSGGFYSNPVDPKFRSDINALVRIKPDKGESDKTYTRLEEKFISEADKAGFKQLRAHSFAPGMRLSMYNAMPLEGIEALIAFMRQFQTQN